MATLLTSGGRHSAADAHRLPCTGLFHLYFSDDNDDIAVAKRLCNDCAVRRACLRDALQRRESCGVWGGQLLRDGEVIAALPRRGRPPRSAA